MSNGTFRMQFGLRTMLIALTIGGVAIGLLGKLYFSNPQLCLGILMFLTTIVPFFLATISLIVFGTRTKQRGLAAWGTTLLLTPILGSGLVLLLQSFVRPSSGGFGLMSNKQIIQRELPKDVDNFSVWRELQRRVEAGEFSKQDVDQVVGGLAADMKRKRPLGWNKPLSRQNDFMKAARSRDLVSKDKLIDVCDAFFGVPRIQPYNAANGGRSSFQIDYGTNWDGDHHHGFRVAHVWKVKEILVDGKAIDLEQPHKFAGHWQAQPHESIPPDAKQLTAQLEIAYIDADKLIGLQARDLPIERWPKAIKRWTTDVKIPLDGTDPNKKPPPPVKLVTDPKEKPPSPQVERLVVQLDEGNARTVVVRLADPVPPPIPISFDVFVKIDDNKIAVGNYYVIPYGSNGMTYGGNECVSRGNPIDSNAEYADVIFEPNVEHLQKAIARNDNSEVAASDKMWGKPIVVPEVKLERLDLEIDK